MRELIRSVEKIFLLQKMQCNNFLGEFNYPTDDTVEGLIN